MAMSTEDFQRSLDAIDKIDVVKGMVLSYRAMWEEAEARVSEGDSAARGDLEAVQTRAIELEADRRELYEAAREALSEHITHSLAAQRLRAALHRVNGDAIARRFLALEAEFKPNAALRATDFMACPRCSTPLRPTAAPLAVCPACLIDPVAYVRRPTEERLAP